MKNNFIKISIFILLLKFITSITYASNPADTNWRSYIYDKQAWGLGAVNKIITDQNQLFVSGFFSFRFYDSLVFNGLAELKDSLWVPLGSGNDVGVRGMFPIINDIQKKDSFLFVAGLFDTAGNTRARNIARWNTNSCTWTTVGNGTNGILTSILCKDTLLFVGGNFDSVYTANDTSVIHNIAKWDGTRWDTLGPKLNGAVYNMYSSGTFLYVTGDFDSIGTMASKHIGIWDMTSNTWSSFGDNGPMGEVTTVCKVGNDLYFGGSFDSLKTDNQIIPCKNIAKFNGTSWDTLKNGISGHIFQMKSDSNNLYVVGSFIKQINDSISYNNIAKWDGSDWSGLGSGTDQFIYTIVLKGDSILVGGTFSFTGDTLAILIGLWYQNPSPPIIHIPLNVKEINDNSLSLKAYPNPFSDKVTFEFYIEKPGIVEIKLTDILGNELKLLTYKEYSEGWHKTSWNSEKYKSGTYLCKMRVGNKSVSTKIILSR